MDKTQHVPERHSIVPLEHTYEWYEAWGNHCPDCGATAVVTKQERAPIETTMGKLAIKQKQEDITESYNKKMKAAMDKAKERKGEDTCQCCDRCPIVLS